MKLAYICTNYNNSAETIAAIDSLLMNNGHEYRCVVVDNLSRPEQVDLLRTYVAGRPEIEAIFNEQNVGYFAGLNIGLEHLERTSPDFVHAVIGNNDLLFPLNFADTVAQQAVRFQSYPVISPSIITADGEHQNPHVIKSVSPSREHLYDLYYSNYNIALLLKWLARYSRPITKRGDEDHHGEGREIYQGHGSCYLFGPRFFTEFGRLWAPTFLFGEEFFLSAQLGEKGYKVYYEPSIMVTHVSHASVSQLPSQRSWEMMRQAHRVYRQHKRIHLKHERRTGIHVGLSEKRDAYRICTNCVMDTSDSKITFDAEGVCDHCTTFRDKILPNWHTDERGQRALEEMAAKIRREGQGRDFDCIIGMSGGIDSSYLTYIAKEQLGLRPLVFHVDGGWNSQESTNNIERIVDQLGLDLFTEVIDWPEMRDLQLAFFKSGVPHIDTPQDMAVFATMYKFAEQHKVRYILTGANLSTECIRNPLEWMYYQSDRVQVRDIHRRFGERPLVKFPLTSILRHKIYLPYIKGIQTVRPLNYMPYIKEDALKLMVEKFGWQPYPQKHFESRFTRFYEGYWLPKKFGYDTRRVQYSSLIVTHQMTREEALKRLEQPALDDDTARQEFEYVATKLGITLAELQGYLDAPSKTHRDYRSQEFLYTVGAAAMHRLGLELGGKR